MEAVKNYVLSLTGFSFISSLACALLPDIPARKTVKFICGIILCVLILAPLPGLNPDFSDIFSEYESYNFYSGNSEMEGLGRNVITDKVSEIVGKAFENKGINDVMAEVVFDSEGNILSVNIDAYNEEAAKEAASALGLPYEIMHMTE